MVQGSGSKSLAPSPTVAPVEEKDTCHMRRRIHVI
jgi:hypothetical protein